MEKRYTIRTMEICEFHDIKLLIFLDQTVYYQINFFLILGRRKIIRVGFYFLTFPYGAVQGESLIFKI